LSEPPLAGASRNRVAIFIVVGALTGIAPLSIDAYIPGLPELTSDLGTSASTGQLTLTAFLLGLALSQVVAGSISDNIGRRTPVIAGLLAYVVSSLLCGLSPNIWTLILLRLVQGAAAGVGFVIARAIIRDLYTGSAGARVFARLVLISGVAPVVAPIIGGQVLRFTSWRGLFVVFALFSAVLLAVANVVLVETLPEHLRHEPGMRTKVRVFRRLLGDRTFLPYALVGSLGFAAMFSYIAGAPFVLEDIHGLSPQQFSVAFAANAAGLVALSQISGRFVERIGPSALLRAGAVMSAAGGVITLLSVVLDAGLASLLAGLWLMVSAIGLIVPNSTALALAHQGERAGSASALYGLGQFGLGAVLAPLAGIAGNHDALPMAITIAVCGLGALLIYELWCDRAPLEPAFEPAP
jgi:MFS transporter, DHA1 family, multidrug resistance protein